MPGTKPQVQHEPAEHLSWWTELSTIAGCQHKPNVFTISSVAALTHFCLLIRTLLYTSLSDEPNKKIINMVKMLCSSITLQLPELHIQFHWHLAHLKCQKGNLWLWPPWKQPDVNNLNLDVVRGVKYKDNMKTELTSHCNINVISTSCLQHRHCLNGKSSSFKEYSIWNVQTFLVNNGLARISPMLMGKSGQSPPTYC